ncbi:hypothetical protein AAG906_015378 [Vitis piasezkii]
MVDGFRWKPILEPTNVDRLKKYYQPISGLILTSHHHYTYHYQFILLHLPPYRHHIHVRHPQVHDSWDLLYILHFTYEVASLMCRTDSVVFGLPGSFMDPHRFACSLSLTGCSLRRGHDRYLMEPGFIQLVPHFSTLGCHHAAPSGRTSWIYVHDSVMDLDGVTCVMIDDFMSPDC